MTELNQWTNEPNLQWQNVPNKEWISTIVERIAQVRALFIAKSKAFYFLAEDRTRNFVSKIKNYYFESNSKP